MDAFFAAIEQRDRPELRGQPVVVGGLSRRGVVSTASYEARRFGIRSAMPMLEARSRCPHAVFLPGRMPVYRRESARVFEIFDRFSPVVEGLSLDEAFLDLSGSERLLGTAETVAHALRGEVYGATGLRVSVGVGPVKLVAKIASDLAKPDGVRVVRPGEVSAFLDPLPVSRIWGLGRTACERLDAAGIRTIGQLRARSELELRRWIGARAGTALRFAHGRDERRVEADRERKSYGEERTFEADRIPAALASVVSAQAESVARRLRRDSRRARGLTLKLKLAERLGPGKYRIVTRSRTFAQATDDGRVLAEIARRLLTECAIETPIRLIGVAATRLESAQAGSLELFAPPESARRARLDRTLDAIRTRFGDASLHTGGEGVASVRDAAPGKRT